MDWKEIIKQIESLPLERQAELHSILTAKLKQRELLTKSLDEIRGAGKGIWDMDAQEYVNQLRANDRF